jgi:VanZ family protein
VRRLLVLFILLILYGSLYPFDFEFWRPIDNPVWTMLRSWPHPFDRFAFRDGASNVVLYVPLGFAAALAFGRRWWAGLLLGLALSAGVEIVQLYDADRTSSLWDVVCNTAGTVFGVLAARLLPVAQKLERESDRLNTGPTIVAGCWIGFQLYPFVPLLSRGHLHASISAFSNTPVSWVEIAAGAAEWLALGLVAEGAMGGIRTLWLPVAILCLPVRLLLADRTLAPSEVLGAGLALILWAGIRGQRRRIVGACLLGAAIVLLELEPFRFASQPLHAFSWIPFSATMAANRLPAVLIIFRRAFDYGAMVWLLPIPRARAGILVAAALVVLEWLQRYLPNRQPEIMDSMLALMMTLTLVWERR